MAHFDLDERLSALGGWASSLRPFRSRTLFIHVPRAAGASICAALGQKISHHTLRYYENRFGPRLRDHHSFAVVRDPISRCLSAYFFVINRGTDLIPLNHYWGLRTKHVASFDQYVEFLWRNRTKIDSLDHVMRTQSYYVRGEKYLELPSRLFIFGSDQQQIADHVRKLSGRDIATLNQSRRAPVAVTLEAEEKIREIYRCDFQLLDEVAARRPAKAPSGAQFWSVRQLSQVRGAR